MNKNERTYLNPHHLQLKQLHLNLGLGRGKGRGEGDAIWVHRLMVRVSILRDVLVEYMVVVFLKGWSEIESGSWGSGMRMIKG